MLGGGTSMKLKKVILENVRCFEHKELEIPSECCVLVGRNGCGKSTILRAITNLYISIMGLDQNEEFVDGLFETRDIRFGKSFVSILIEFALNTEEEQLLQSKTFSVRMGWTSDQIFYMLPNEFEGEEELRTYAMNLEVFMDSVRNKGRVIYFDAYRFMSEDNPVGPVVSENMKKNVPLLQMSIDKKGHVTNKIMQLKQWLINVDYIRLKSEDNQYDLLYHHLTHAFDLLLHPLKYSGIDETGNILFFDEDNQIPIEIDLLSDGFKSVFQILVGTMKMFFESANDEEPFYMSEGVVLIDEIDCHIHPRWQKNILPSFKELFPNCQFIVTTHSPYIISSVNDSEVIQIGDKTIE